MKPNSGLICLYHVSGLKGLPSQIVNTGCYKKNYCYVDPNFYSPDIENEIQEYSFAEARCAWSKLEDSTFVYSNQTQQILCWASEETRQHLRINKLPYSFLSTEELKNLLRMAQRTHLSTLPFSEIIFYIERIYSFWNDYLSLFRISTVFSSLVPHSFTDYIFSLAAKHLGIPFICQIPQGLFDHCFLLNLTTQKYINNYSDLLSKNDEAYKEFFSYLKNCTLPTGRLPYTPRANLIRMKTLSDTKRFFLSGSSRGARIINSRVQLARTYDLLSISTNQLDNILQNSQDKIHVYFLHYQPEQTTNPLALDFSEQRKAIEYIRANIPHDNVLLVKEHPHQFLKTPLFNEGSDDHLVNALAYRSKEYYEFILQMNNTFLVPRNISSEKLLLPSSNIWVSTGTVALEAFVRRCKVHFLATLSPFHFLDSHIKNLPNMSNFELLNYIAYHASTYLFKTVRINHTFVLEQESASSSILECIRSQID